MVSIEIETLARLLIDEAREKRLRIVTAESCTGGLVAGAAIAAIFVAGGVDDVRQLVPVAPWTVLGAGLVLAAGVAVAPLLLGDPVMDAWKLEPSLPMLGSFKLSSALVFDVGVALVVVGLVFMVFEAFGDEEPPEYRGEVRR